MGSALSDRGFIGGDAPLATVPRGPRLKLINATPQQLYEYGLDEPSGQPPLLVAVLGAADGFFMRGR